MSTSSDIYAHAMKDVGLHELPGSQSQPRIFQAIKVAALWLDGDDSKTAWCGCIRGLWGLETGTGVPREHYRAANWLKWGRAAELPVKGDTVIISRKGGHHVGLFDHFSTDLKGVWLLGGNQSDKVGVNKYDVTSILGIRRG